ncbi:MAG: cytochrome c maturation protein CcmE [Actinomycetota bacterium]|nr:cytochrome c maturation protein CcmE [Actinomycetota bacterium]
MDVTDHGTRFDDEESADARGGLDVTPRTGEHHDSDAGGGRRRLAIAGVVVLVAALGVVLFNGLTDASTFYYNVDEAVAQRDDLGTDRFRMQGNVIDGTISETDNGVAFVIAFGDTELNVEHRGDPPELFDAEIPVIIEGAFDGDEFRSDKILIKHDSTYEEENDARLREAEQDAARRSEASG